MLRKPWWGVLLICCAAFAADSSSKSVIATLNSKWNSTSLFAEISEFMSKENEQLFWRFITETAEKCSTVKCDQVSDETKYEIGLKQAMMILSPSSIDLLKLSLSLRIYSPTVQLFQQIGSEHAMSCAAFFDVHGTKGCNAGELENALISAHERDVPELLTIDHVFNFGRKAETVAIIYGEIGTQDWLQLHAKAVELASAQKMRYVLRHYKAAQRIISEEGENALQTLTQLSQDFPRYARSLTREIVLKDVRREIELNQKDHLTDAGTGVKLTIYLITQCASFVYAP
ncbi:hypothetical protein TELCIR_05658 [Teladorsagia circumcincta]|uniref:UGGT thioredoxin-like domain-containing protein n=1 Tax=Teladorsagia circumcincta TaxID=45464 RepID=A0A2G9UQ94_TELCI|nr:hypothetical protein TELCIR_05658 [Teladorsagia circumcincta]